MQQANCARQFWHRRDAEEVKREVISNKEEEKKCQEQARLCSAFCSCWLADSICANVWSIREKII